MEVTVLLKQRLKSFALGFIAFITLFISIAPTVAHASDSYFLAFTYSLDSVSVQPTVSYSEVENTVTNQVEVQSGPDGDDVMYVANSSQDLVFLLNNGEGSNMSSTPGLNEVASYFHTGNAIILGKNEYTIPFSFPGRHVGTGIGSGVPIAGDAEFARNANSADEAQAGWVGNQLTNGFNRVLTIAFQAEHGNKATVTREDIAAVATKVADLGVGSGSETFGSGTNRAVTISAGAYESGETNPHIDDSFYRNITVKFENNSASNMNFIVPVQVNKGYSSNENDRMYGDIVGTKYFNDEYSGRDVYSISWRHMIAQANMNAYNEVFIGNVHELNPPGRVENAIVRLLGSMVGGLRNMFGLSSVTDMVFNQGSYKDSTIYGTMPQQLGSVADYVYFLMVAVAFVVLLGSFVFLLFKSNLSVMNPQMRVDLKDGMLSIIGAFFMLAVFPPIWSTLLQINFSLVTFFSGISVNSANFAGNLLTGGGNIAMIILSIAFLVVEIWFNVFYIVRALTIMIFYMIGPLAIASIAYGDKYRMIFSSWIKELLGALFIQAIHAVIIGSLAAGMDRGIASGFLWQLVILLSVIPLGNVVRGTVLNLGGDSMSKITERGEKGLLTGAAIGGGLAMKGASSLAGSAAAGGASSGGSARTGTISSGSRRTATSTGGTGGGGGGGGGSPQTIPSVELSDLSDNPIQTGNAQRLASGDLSHQEKIAQNYEGSFAQKAGDTISSGTQKVGEVLNSKGGRAVGHAIGGVLTAGAQLGDLATDGGSSSALLTASHIMGGRKGQSGGGSGGGGSYSGAEDIASMAPKASHLKSLEKKGQVGSKGELTLSPTSDQKQLLTSSASQLSKATGINNVQALPANNQNRQGLTRFDVGQKADGSSMPAEQKQALDFASRISHANRTGVGATPEIREAYRDMREQTGIADVRYDDKSNSYRVDIDNQSMGWDGTAADDNYLMIKADSTADKNMPDFNTANGANTQRFTTWAKEKRNLEPLVSQDIGGRDVIGEANDKRETGQ